MRGLVLLVTGALTLAVAATLGPVALAGDKPKSGDERQDVNGRDVRGVNFIESCRFSHRAPDDPIVFPGKPGSSHDHTFVGNRTTSASSTFGSLRSGSTSCRRSDDTAAYWMPTLYQGTTAVIPAAATIYYRRGTFANVRPFPNNLRMIAGDATATSPQDFSVVFWNCGGGDGGSPSSTVPSCPDVPGSALRLHVRFPNCWDGRRLDSPDHKSHMAYSVRGRCPSSHRVAVPAITVLFRYPSRGGDGFSLASGGQLSGHADFVNAWNPGSLRTLVEDCLNDLVRCGRG
jgi:Domain of unknown function (DUF1996)